MPEIDIHIGGRVFQVACQEGEEHFLQSAAALLDNEAQALAEALGRVPEARMLLMAGLMLADKTAGLEEELRLAEKRLIELEQASSAPAPVPLHAPEPEQVEVRVEVPVIPEEVVAAFADIADRTEAVAGALETAVG
jgi:cell division protein ZapA